MNWGLMLRPSVYYLYLVWYIIKCITFSPERNSFRRQSDFDSLKFDCFSGYANAVIKVSKLFFHFDNIE